MTVKNGLKDFLQILAQDETFLQDVDENTTILDLLNQFNTKLSIYFPNSPSPSVKKKANTINEALDDLTTNLFSTQNGGITKLENTILHKFDKQLVAGYSDSLTNPLPEVYTANVTVIKNGVFGIPNIKKLFLDYTAQLKASGFSGNNYLEEIRLPYLQSVDKKCFQNISALKLLDLGKGGSYSVLTTSGDDFSGCPNLEVIVVRYTGAMVKPTAGTFTDTKLDLLGAGGYVYVPQKFLSQYQASTEWAERANVLEFRAIEGSIFEDKDHFHEYYTNE